ncbi:hypothetical protein D3C86_2168330 [compost metagenome]
MEMAKILFLPGILLLHLWQQNFCIRSIKMLTPGLVMLVILLPLLQEHCVCTIINIGLVMWWQVPDSVLLLQK